MNTITVGSGAPTQGRSAISREDIDIRGLCPPHARGTKPNNSSHHQARGAQRAQGRIIRIHPSRVLANRPVAICIGILERLTIRLVRLADNPLGDLDEEFLVRTGRPPVE